MQWPTLGPYHVARIEAFRAHARKQDAEVVPLQTAARELAVQASRHRTPAQGITVFPDAFFEDIPPVEIHRGVTAALDEARPDALCINSYSLPDARACIEWAIRNECVSVLMFDSKADDAPRVRWREQVKSLIVGQFDAALVAGTVHAAYLAELGFAAERIFTGYDVIDNAAFDRASARIRGNPTVASHLPGLGDRSPFFLAVGRLIDRKNTSGLINAYAAYRRTSASPWRLVIVGDGPRRKHVEGLLRETSIDGVTLAGRQSPEDISAYYALASAFVHPAHSDQWALVVNEAMACGLPVIVSTGAGCARDLVRDEENGYTFSPDDPEELAEKLAMVSSSPERLVQMGSRAREIISDWSVDRFARNLWAAIEVGKRAQRDRPPSFAALSILRAIRMLSRSTDSFQSVER